MKPQRIKELRKALTDESISYGELIEIEQEAKRIGIDTDECIMGFDQLNEIEAANKQ